jgi:hypothetical protein
MSRELVDIAIVELNGQELQTVREMTVGKPDTQTPVKTMTRKRRAIGYTRGIPDYNVSLECAQLAGRPEVDWDRLKETGERFLLVYEKAVDGVRRQLIDCVVDDISEPYSAEGESRITVSIKALDEKSE